MNLVEANKNAREIYVLIKKGVSPEEAGFYVLQSHISRNLDKKIHRLLTKLNVESKLIKLVDDFSNNKVKVYVDKMTNTPMISYKDVNSVFAPKSIDEYLDSVLDIGSHLKFYPVLKMYFSQDKYISILMASSLKK